MRAAFVVLLLSIVAVAQDHSPSAPNTSAPSTAETTARPGEITLAAGTKVPLALKQAISTKNAREGDAVYAETTFPVVQNERIVIPPHTYVQGRISSIKRPGRVKGRAEVLIHFTTLIYPSGYTVLLPGAVENVPGAEHAQMKGDEGTIREEGQKGKDVGTVASTAGTGAAIGALSGAGLKGAGIGAGVGGAVGTAIALLSKGNDVRLEAGSTLEMVIQRPITLDGNRIPRARQD